MTAASAQVIGLLVATAVYGTALIITRRLAFARVSNLPGDRDHQRELREHDAESRRLEPIWEVLARPRWLLMYLAPVAIASAVYGASGTSIPIEIAVCAVGGATLTGVRSSELKKRNIELALRLHLSQERLDAALRPIYLPGLFITTTALLGIGCFLGGAIGTFASS
jgi:hypothetical protein